MHDTPPPLSYIRSAILSASCMPSADWTIRFPPMTVDEGTASAPARTGESLYAIGRPDQLRRLEEAARGEPTTTKPVGTDDD